LLEVVVEDAMHRGELLQLLHAAQAKHGALASSERLARILRAAVRPSVHAYLPERISDHVRDNTIGGQSVIHRPMRAVISLHQLFQEVQGDLAITLFGGNTFKHLALVIHGSPEIVGLAVDLQQDLVEMASPLRAASVRNRALPDLTANMGPKRVRQRRIVLADSDGTLSEKVLDVAQGPRR
jgi:hypothetical protein